MISLFYDNENKVNLVYYADLPEELRDKKHLEVEKLFDPEEKAGKVAVLYANEEKYWYVYEDKILDKEEVLENKVKALTNSQSDTEDLLQEIILKLYS